MVHPKVKQASLSGNANAVQDVELGLLERRCHLVLNNLDAGAVAHRFRAFFQRFDATDVEANRSVELERLAAGGGFWAAKEDADLLAKLVDENHGRAGLAQSTGELSKCLRHQTRLEANVGVTHLTLDFRARNQGCHGVDDDHVDRSASNEHVCDLERLLSSVRLGHQERVDIDTEVLGIFGV